MAVAVQFIVSKPNGQTVSASGDDLKRNLADVGGYALQFTNDEGIKEDVYEFERLGQVAAGRKTFKVLTKALAAGTCRFDALSC